jgi:hypothetical protein
MPLSRLLVEAQPTAGHRAMSTPLRLALRAILRNDRHAATTKLSEPRPHPLPFTHRNPVLQRPLEFGQYVSLGFGQASRDVGIAISMGSRGDAYDKASCLGSCPQVQSRRVDSYRCDRTAPNDQ